tara:strand:- start:148 stop:348 length:201 start_codon:yes stop_codon:yes gene_type:complete
MKNFTYDEVIELMSECLNNLDEQIDTNEYVKIIADTTYDLDTLYDEISIDFKERLDNLARFKKALS